MTENKKMPDFDSIDELTAFFDDNDLGDYIENLPESEFEVNLQKHTYFVAVNEELSRKLIEISKREHQSSEKIVNKWLNEKISNYSEKV